MHVRGHAASAVRRRRRHCPPSSWPWTHRRPPSRAAPSAVLATHAPAASPASRSRRPSPIIECAAPRNRRSGARWCDPDRRGGGTVGGGGRWSIFVKRRHPALRPWWYQPRFRQRPLRRRCPHPLPPPSASASASSSSASASASPSASVSAPAADTAGQLPVAPLAHFPAAAAEAGARRRVARHRPLQAGQSLGHRLGQRHVRQRRRGLQSRWASRSRGPPPASACPTPSRWRRSRPSRASRGGHLPVRRPAQVKGFSWTPGRRRRRRPTHRCPSGTRASPGAASSCRPRRRRPACTGAIRLAARTKAGRASPIPRDRAAIRVGHRPSLVPLGRGPRVKADHDPRGQRGLADVAHGGDEPEGPRCTAGPMETTASGAANSPPGCLFWRKLLSPGCVQFGSSFVGMVPSSLMLVTW